MRQRAGNAFETSDFLFLIRLNKLNQKDGNPEGTAEAELPWRIGTAARSATRQQILSLLYKVPPLPDIEVLGSAFLPIENNTGSANFDRGFCVKLCVIPRSRDSVVIPFHRVKWTIQLPNGVEREFEESCQFRPENDYVAWRDLVNLGHLIPVEFRKGVLTGATRAIRSRRARPLRGIWPSHPIRAGACEGFNAGSSHRSETSKASGRFWLLKSRNMGRHSEILPRIDARCSSKRL
jgi:hypothetical protein